MSDIDPWQRLRARIAILELANNDLRAENERLRAALKWYGDPANHFNVPASTPYYDPAYIFVEEPPIVEDGGKRAREALKEGGR